MPNKTQQFESVHVQILGQFRKKWTWTSIWICLHRNSYTQSKNKQKNNFLETNTVWLFLLSVFNTLWCNIRLYLLQEGVLGKKSESGFSLCDSRTVWDLSQSHSRVVLAVLYALDHYGVERQTVSCTLERFEEPLCICLYLFLNWVMKCYLRSRPSGSFSHVCRGLQNLC